MVSGGVLPIDPQHTNRVACAQPQTKASVLRGLVPNLPHFNFAHHSKILPQIFKKAQNFAYREGQRVEANVNGVREARSNLPPTKSVRNALAVEEEKLRENDIKAAQDRLQAHIDRYEAAMISAKSAGESGAVSGGATAAAPAPLEKPEDDPKSPMYGLNPETGERPDTGLNLKHTTAKVTDYEVKMNNLNFETMYTPVKPKGNAKSNSQNGARKLASNYQRYQQLVKYEGKNCRFYAVMHDIYTEAYERRHFSIIYFLADDSIQIEETCGANSGRATFFKTFFARSKLPRSFQVGQVGQSLKFEEQDCLTLKDLNVGITLKILGVEFLIYDADSFTREHYKDVHGVTLPPAMDMTIQQPVKVDHSTLNATKKTNTKTTLNIDLDGRRLQWSLSQAGECRAFVLIYFLYDDEMRINSIKASGYGELDSGSYVAKKKYINPATGKYFAPEDFQVGAEFSIYNKKFTVVGMNDFTKKYFDSKAENASAFLAANMTDEQLRLTLQRLLISLSKTSANLQKVFRSFDDGKDHVLCFEDFKGMAYYYGFRLTEEDASRLFRYFDVDEKGQLTFDEFVNCVYEEDYPTGQDNGSKESLKDAKNPALMSAAEKNKLFHDDTEQKRSGRGRPLNMEAWKKRKGDLQPFTQKYLDLLRLKVEERLEVREVQRLLQMLCGMIHHRGSKTRHFLYNEFAHRLSMGGATARIKKQQMLRATSASQTNRNIGENYVSPKQIYDVFNDVFGKELFTQKDVNRVLAFLYPDTWSVGCDYVQFLADLSDTHHEFGQCRDVR